jgi:hypothetical protein
MGYEAVDWVQLRKCPEAVSCVHIDELSGSINGGDFFFFSVTYCD